MLTPAVIKCSHNLFFPSSNKNQHWPEHPVLSHHSSLSSYPSARQPLPHSVSLDYGHHSPPLNHPHIHPAPNAHSSPRSNQRSHMANYTLNHSPAQSFEEQDDSCLGYGADCPNLDRDLLPSMDGQNQLAQMQPPLLPEKKRTSDGEHSLGTASPALSGFSSPRSGSSLSIPFPNILPDLSAQTPGTASPLPGKLGSAKETESLVGVIRLVEWFLLFSLSVYFPDVLANKQVTVKFVQDTSKFWYKPDISRDQGRCQM